MILIINEDELSDFSNASHCLIFQNHWKCLSKKVPHYWIVVGNLLTHSYKMTLMVQLNHPNLFSELVIITSCYLYWMDPVCTSKILIDA